jgi:zinc transport system ATP-binding protein
MSETCVNEHECAASLCGKCCTIIRNLNVEYGDFRALDSVDLHIHCGELTAVIGPNGGGKSTLLKAVLGEVNYSGEILFRPSSGGNRKPLIGYVPQSVSVAKDTPMSVTDFLSLSLQKFPVWAGIRTKTRASVAAALGLVSAGHLASRRLGELSGGELQRVLLARAMNPMPEILLLDEPVSGVDVKGLNMFYETLCGLRRTQDISVILVTHDIEAIAPHADRMLVINKSVLADGPPSEILSNEGILQVLGHRLLRGVRLPVDTEIHGGTK